MVDNRSNAKRRFPPWLRWIVWLTLLLEGILVFGFFLTDYVALVLFLVGLIAAFLFHPGKKPSESVEGHKSRNRSRGCVFIALGIILFLAIAIIALIYFSGVLRPAGPPPSKEVTIEEYTVIIEPVDASMAEFEIHERATLSQTEPPKSGTWDLDCPARQVTVAKRGFLLKEALISPLEGCLPSDTILHADTGNGDIELRDFPQDLFYAARDAENLQRIPYVDNETITWSVRNLDHGVAFAYTPPHQKYLKSILSPFTGATTLNQWIMGLVGLVGGFVVNSVVKPVLQDTLKKKLLPSTEGKETQPAKKATLVVSGSGEEKEIEIDDKSK